MISAELSWVFGAIALLIIGGLSIFFRRRNQRRKLMSALAAQRVKELEMYLLGNTKKKAKQPKQKMKKKEKLALAKQQAALIAAQLGEERNHTGKANTLDEDEDSELHARKHSTHPHVEIEPDPEVITDEAIISRTSKSDARESSRALTPSRPILKNKEEHSPIAPTTITMHHSIVPKDEVERKRSIGDHPPLLINCLTKPGTSENANAVANKTKKLKKKAKRQSPDRSAKSSSSPTETSESKSSDANSTTTDETAANSKRPEQNNVPPAASENHIADASWEESVKAIENEHLQAVKKKKSKKKAEKSSTASLGAKSTETVTTSADFKASGPSAPASAVPVATEVGDQTRKQLQQDQHRPDLAAEKINLELAVRKWKLQAAHLEKVLKDRDSEVNQLRQHVTAARTEIVQRRSQVEDLQRSRNVIQTEIAELLVRQKTADQSRAAAESKLSSMQKQEARMTDELIRSEAARKQVEQELRSRAQQQARAVKEAEEKVQIIYRNQMAQMEQALRQEGQRAIVLEKEMQALRVTSQGEQLVNGLGGQAMDESTLIYYKTELETKVAQIADLQVKLQCAADEIEAQKLMNKNCLTQMHQQQTRWTDGVASLRCQIDVTDSAHPKLGPNYDEEDPSAPPLISESDDLASYTASDPTGAFWDLQVKLTAEMTRTTELEKALADSEMARLRLEKSEQASQSEWREKMEEVELLHREMEAVLVETRRELEEAKRKLEVVTVDSRHGEQLGPAEGDPDVSGLDGDNQTPVETETSSFPLELASGGHEAVGLGGEVVEQDPPTHEPQGEGELEHTGSDYHKQPQTSHQSQAEFSPSDITRLSKAEMEFACENSNAGVSIPQLTTTPT